MWEDMFHPINFTTMKTDTQITQNVLAELAWEPLLRADNLRVIANRGVVTIEGDADSAASRSCALRAAGRVAGVREVVDRIIIAGPVTKQNSDEELLRKAFQVLRWNSSLRLGKLRVSVLDGWISLEGTVRWEFQKKNVAAMILDIPDVKGISNKIDVLTPVTHSDKAENSSSWFDLIFRRDKVEHAPQTSY
jgi:osmotically-inducible protein OsmY